MAVPVDFKCDTCGHVQEIMTGEEIPLHCGVTMRRIFSIGGISFKGSGFYVTDYKKENKKEEASDGE
jgi:predicted nucleic acid-binding Zn ribbon protein